MNLASALHHLEVSDLVRRLAETDPVTGSAAYAIKHTMLQSTAQESLLRQEQRRLNRLVAETLEGMYSARLDEFAARLMQHYDAAGEIVKTIEYAERAGNHALELSAYPEAIAAYRRAFERAQTHPTDPSLTVRLMTLLGRAYELHNEYAAALALYHQTCDSARANANPQLELAALVQLAKVYSLAAMSYDAKQSRENGREGLTLARRLGDRRAEATLLWTMMLLNIYGAGGAGEGIKYGEQSLALARELDAREQMAYTLNDLVYAYMNLGDAARSRRCAQEAIALWRELDNKPMLTDALNSLAMDHLLGAAFEESIARARESRALAQSINNLWGETTSYMVEGYAELERGGFTVACDAFQQCIQSGDRIGVRGPIVMVRYELARLYAFLGDPPLAERYAQEALTQTLEYGLDWLPWAYAVRADVLAQRGAWQDFDLLQHELGSAPPAYYFERMVPIGAAFALQMRARALLRGGELDAAQTLLTELLAYLDASTFQTFVPETLRVFAHLWLARGEMTQAGAVLDRAQALAQELGMCRAVFELALTRLEWASRSAGAAALATARLEAQRARDALCARLSPALCVSFLQTNPAQRVDAGM